MYKEYSLTIGAIICLIVTYFSIYYLSLQDKVVPLSIASMHDAFELKSEWRALTAGLLPIYLALLIFGAGFVCVYVGNLLQYWFVLLFKKYSSSLIPPMHVGK